MSEIASPALIFAGRKHKLYTGDRFGHLVATGETYWRGYLHVRLNCDCGGHIFLPCHIALKGARKKCETCGTPRKNSLQQQYLKEYNIWITMKLRCIKPTDKDYPNYGGRGIGVSDSWRHSFEAFLNDIGPQPFPDATLERLDVNGNYEAGNVTWIPRSEQKWNKQERPTSLTIDGAERTYRDWSKETGVSILTIKNRMKAGWTAKEAVFTPKGAKRGEYTHGER